MTPADLERHRAILAALCRVCDAEGTDEVALASEWLGWLPYGLYCWVEVGGRSDVDRDLPRPWDVGELKALAAAGYLLELGVEEGADGFSSRVRYRIAPRGRALVGAPSPGEGAVHGDGATPGASGASDRIVGTAETTAGEHPFAFDPTTGVLSLGFHRPSRTPAAPAADQLARLGAELAARLGVGMDRVRVGEYRCYDCGQWFDVMRDPQTWSVGMCLSCSMDRSSEIAEGD